MSIRFTQSCPTCGRRVQVRASLIGYTVACQHCNAEFIAEADVDCHPEPVAPIAMADPLMVRVEEALRRAAHQQATTPL